MLWKIGAGIFFVVCVAVIIVTNTQSEQTTETPLAAPLISDVEKVIKPDFYRAAKTGEYLPLEPTKSGNQRHFHIGVRFVTDGVPVLPPRQVGVTARGTLAIHTHDQSGLIHLHEPLDGKPFLFSDVWKAWGLTVNASSFAGIKPYCLYLNGTAISLADAQRRPMRDHDDYQIVFATCSAKPPLGAFDFDAVDFYQNEATDPNDVLNQSTKKSNRSKD